MPIKFTGPVKPRKLKSPDPINMPLVRDNRSTRVKADVQYYKEHGEMPRVSDPWTSISEYITMPASAASARGADSVTVDGDVMVIHVGDMASGNLYFYKHDGMTWNLTETKQLNNLITGQTIFDRENGCIFVGRPTVSSTSGQTLRYDFDFSTATITGAGEVCADLTSTAGLEGRQNVVYKDLQITSSPHWRQGTDYGGMIGYRLRTDPVNSRKTITHTLVDSSTYTSTALIGYEFPNDDLLFGGSMDVDQDRLLVAAIASPSENSGAHALISVFEYDDVAATMTEVQRITNPYPVPGNSYRPIAVRGHGGTMLVVCTGSKEQDNANAFSIIEYTWNGTEYVQDSWYTLPAEIYTGTQARGGMMYNITMLSETEILIPFQDSTGRIMKVTK